MDIKIIVKKNPEINSYWAARECELGNLSFMQAAEINNALESWDELVNDRTIKMEKLWPHAVDWLPNCR